MNKRLVLAKLAVCLLVGAVASPVWAADVGNSMVESKISTDSVNSSVFRPDARGVAVPATSVETMEVQGDAHLPPTQPRAPEPVRVDAGVGAQSLDAVRNELGIELRNLENIDELSLWRRGWPGLVTPQAHGQWTYEAYGALAEDGQARLRARGPTGLGQLTIETGARRDRRAVSFLDNQGTVYDATDDRMSAFTRRQDFGYAKLDLTADSWEALGDFDLGNREIRAGPLRAGWRTDREATAGFQWLGAWGALTPFAQARVTGFASDRGPLYSNGTNSLRGGTQWDDSFGRALGVSTTASYEGAHREYRDGLTPAADFSRGELRSMATLTPAPWDTGWGAWETRLQAGVDLSQDQIGKAGPSGSGAGSSGSTVPGSTVRSSTAALWDAGAELSSSRQRTWGGLATMRRFAHLPKASQRFGDGGVLLGSPDLPAETGVRVSAGPWLKSAPGRNNWAAEFQFFSERAWNSPIAVATSPMNARTLPLGGIWNQGMAFHPEVHRAGWIDLACTGDYTYQDAVNNSGINWQRGQRVPGRPSFLLKTRIEGSRKGWGAGIDHAFTGADALDLSGLWTRPAFHRLDAFAGYGTIDWHVRVVALNLWVSNQASQNLDFAGQAGPNLLEPELLDREWRVEWEMVL